MTKQSKPRAMRYYTVTDKETGKTVALIQAPTVAQVRNHVAEKTWDIQLADQAAMFAAAKDGLEPETVGESTEGNGNGE
jgi:hypothetical protein